MVNRLMNRAFKTFGIVILGLTLVSCSKKQEIERPEYPASYETIESLAEEFGLDYDIVEDDSLIDLGVNTFQLREGNFSVISLRTIYYNGERELKVTFHKSTRVLPNDIYRGTTLEDSGKLLEFISYLYGGLTSGTELYETIVERYEEGAFSETEAKGVLKWSGDVGAVNCEVSVQIVEELGDKVYITTLYLSE